LTTNLALESAPGNVLLEKEESRLSKDSVLVISQLSAIDKSRLIERVHRVALVILDDVEYGLRTILGLA